MNDAYTLVLPPVFRVASCQELQPPNDSPIRVIHPDGGIRVELRPLTEIAAGWYRLELKFPLQGVVDAVVNVSSNQGDEFWLRPGAVDRNYFAAEIRLTGILSRITLMLIGSGDVRKPNSISFERVNLFYWLVSLAHHALYALKRDRFGFIRSAVRAIAGLARSHSRTIGQRSASREGETPYDTWIRVFDENPASDRGWHQQRLKLFSRRPLLSCLACFTSFDACAIERLALSVGEQIYPHWQLVVACSPSLTHAIRDALQSRNVDLGSVHFIPMAADLALTLNALVAAATGEFVLQIPPGALLRAHALLELALLLDCYPDAELVYSDADRLDAVGRRHHPQFKPAWSPNHLVEMDYAGDLALFRRQTVQRIGGWRSSAGHARDHDLKLRIAEHVESRRIIHLAKVLVHLPQTDQRSASANSGLLHDLIERRQYRAIVKAGSTGKPRLHYLPSEPPLISLIIPTRDRAELLKTCISSILEHTLYRRFEIIVVDNDSREAVTHRLIESLRQEAQVRILRSPGEFNFSAINNLAAREARGTLLALINNDIEVIHGDWLDEMVGLAARPDIGCVGAKLLYPDGRIQHAGIAVGIMGLAGHVYRFFPGDTPGDMDQLCHTREVSAVTAACLVVRRSVFAEVGGMDEKELKVAFNDVDFCLKVRAAGYLNLWTPYAELIHHELASRGYETTPAKAERLAFEAQVLHRRWGEKVSADPYYSPNLTHDREDFSVRVQ